MFPLQHLMEDLPKEGYVLRFLVVVLIQEFADLLLGVLLTRPSRRDRPGLAGAMPPHPPQNSLETPYYQQLASKA